MHAAEHGLYAGQEIFGQPGQPDAIQKTGCGTAESHGCREITTQIFADQSIRFRRPGIAVNNPGTKPLLIKISGNGSQPQRRHNVGHPGNIPSGQVKPVPQRVN